MQLGVEAVQLRVENGEFRIQGGLRSSDVKNAFAETSLAVVNLAVDLLNRCGIDWAQVRKRNAPLFSKNIHRFPRVAPEFASQTSLYVVFPNSEK